MVVARINIQHNTAPLVSELTGDANQGAAEATHIYFKVEMIKHL